MNGEIWKKCYFIPGEVWVSNKGSVRVDERLAPYTKQNGISGTQLRPAQTLKPDLGNNGYYVVKIQVSGTRRKHLLHRLVAMAFLGIPNDPLTVNHMDGNKLNNCVENLEWVTLAENTRHQWRIGLVDIRGEKHPLSKLSNHQASVIKRSPLPVILLAKIYGVSSTLVYKIKQGKKRIAA